MNFIEYVKQVWKNGPSGSTPWSAARLNHIEDGIKSNNDMISELNSNMVIKQDIRQGGTAFKIKFSGYVSSRTPFAMLIPCGQNSIYAPIMIAANDAANQDISTSRLYISENNVGIVVGESGSLNIPTDIGGKWGIFRLFIFDNSVSAKAIYD